MLFSECSSVQQKTQDLAFFDLYVCSLVIYGTGAMFAILFLGKQCGGCAHRL